LLVCSLAAEVRYDMIEEFNVDSKAECRQLNLAHVARNKTRSHAVARIADRTAKIVGSRDLGHAQFQGKLFVRLLGIADTKLHTKFEVSSPSSFRDIAL